MGLVLVRASSAVLEVAMARVDFVTDVDGLVGVVQGHEEGHELVAAGLDSCAVCVGEVTVRQFVGRPEWLGVPYEEGAWEFGAPDVLDVGAPRGCSSV